MKNINLSFVQKENIFQQLQSCLGPESRVAIAVSGGPDSVFAAFLLQDFFLTSKYPLDHLHIIHCNHTTRKENKEEETFIQQLFSDSQVHIHQKPSGGKITEANLRNRRYKVFDQVGVENKIDYLVTGHNLTDRVETTFLNLLRGCGRNGFLGMQFCDQSPLLSSTKVLRPLLGLSKSQITLLCDQNKLSYLTDPTNSESETSLRNRLRNDVLPQLYELSHKSTDETNTFLESLQNVYDALDISNSDSHILEPIILSPRWEADWGYIISIEQQQISSEHIVQLLNTLGIYNNIDKKFIHELTDFLRHKSKGYKYFNGTYFFVAHQKIYMIKAPKDFWEKTSSAKHVIDVLGTYEFDGYALAIDDEKLVGSTLRYAQEGDIYRGKKFGKRCINQKIPIFWRNFVPLAEKEGKIIRVFSEVMK